MLPHGVINDDDIDRVQLTDTNVLPAGDSVMYLDDFNSFFVVQ